MSRTLAIGDIHGCINALKTLLDEVGLRDDDTIITLGDYIDRGEQSKEIIDLLLGEPLAGFEIVHLLGNHEQPLLDFLQHPKAVASWLTYGGQATLMSYGVGVEKDIITRNIKIICDELKEKCPENHLDFYRSCGLIHVEGSYCFVHAGIRPGVKLNEQRNEDLLWIREDFTGSKATHEHIVVHGHTITPEVEWLPNRIGIDTGAFHTGVLTCLVLEGEEQRLLQTG